MNNYYGLNSQQDFTNDLLVEKYMNNLSNLENLDLTQISLEPCPSNVINVPNVPNVISAPDISLSKIIRKTINIDSRFRDAYYNSKSSNFYIDLPETFKKIVKIELTAYTIPISIHGINSSNNYFLIKNNTTPATSVIDISYGNYSTPCSNRIVSPADRNIKTVISSKLTSYDISYNIDVITGKSVLKNNSSSTSYTLLFNTNINKEFEEKTVAARIRLEVRI